MAAFPNLMLALAVVLAGIQDATSVQAHNRTKREAKCPSCQKNPLCAPKFEMYPGHTACMSPSSVAKPIIMTEQEKQDIVNYHNKLRSEAQPPPSDMQEMRWDAELEMVARRWADACSRRADRSFHHDDLRFIPGRFGVGQNIGNGFKDFKAVTDAWYAEKTDYAPYFGTLLSDFPPGPMIGHYTQIVWANTSLIGCASTYCENTNFFVCNYGPAGNVFDFSSPYKAVGGLGSQCQSRTNQGLCDCDGVVCSNFGGLDVSTCTCKCFYDQYTGMCNLNCPMEDLSYCGKLSPFLASDCNKHDTPSACPNLCGICPCADTTYKPAMCDIASRIPNWTVGTFFGTLPDKLNCLILLYIIRWFTETF